ncbi:hypothetical protein PybrP1_004179 [[Pythium] brassicae (nom. inval.)]|nr:hypothetical protein PybrP1_004179 [[Pythium] brassicae (nom. inval.)]
MLAIYDSAKLPSEVVRWLAPVCPLLGLDRPLFFRMTPTPPPPPSKPREHERSWRCGGKTAVGTASSTSGDGWKKSFVPFAANLDGAALVTDAGSRSAVFEFGDDGRGGQLAPTLLQYLEEYRNRLLSGQFDFVDDVGLVERSRK